MRRAGEVALVLVSLVLVSAGLLRFAIWPNLPRWQPQIEQRLAALAGRQVHIDSLSAGFDGWRPWVVATGLRVRDDDGVDALMVGRLRAVLSVRAALRGRFALALLESEAPFVRIERVTPDRIRIGGFEQTLDGFDGTDRLGWVLLQRKVVLHGAHVEMVDRVGGSRIDLSGIDLNWGLRGRRARGSLRIPAWGELARGVDAALEFSWPAFGAPLDWRRWRGEAWAGVRGADLAALFAASRVWLDGTGLAASVEALGIESGWSGFRLWTFFGPDQASRTVLRLAVEDMRASVRDRVVPLSGLRVDARASHDAAGRTTILFGRLELDDDRGQRFEAVAAEPMLRLRADGQPLAARLALGNLDAGPVLDWVRRFPLSGRIRAALEPLQIEGRVRRAALTWSTEPADAHGAFEADFEALSFAWRDPAPLRPGDLHLPGFRNVSGRVRATLDGGEAQLHGRDLQLIFPGLFAEPAVPLQRLDGRISWSVGAIEDGPDATGAPLSPDSPPQAGEAAGRSTRLPVRVTIESMRFANADAAGEVAGTWRSGGGRAGIADLSGRLVRADARQTARYLPLVVPVHVRDWVRDAIRGGRSDDVRFVLRGDLADFPWPDPAAGTFLVEARLSDARLSYAPDWPSIDRIDGVLRFERAGMRIDAHAGRTWRIALGSTRAQIDDFGQPVLQVQGSGSGPAQDLLRFVRESPLRGQFGEPDSGLTVGGDASLQLSLSIPLDAPAQARAQGSIRFGGNDVAPGNRLPPFGQLSGQVRFTENSLALRDVSAHILGGTVHLTGDGDDRGHLRLGLRGDVSAPALARWRLAAGDGRLAARVQQRVAGMIGFDARFERDDRGSSFELTTDLDTVSSSLPPPFAKAPEERWPVRLTVTDVPADHSTDRPAAVETLDLSVPDRARLIVEHERRAEETILRRGVLAVGTPAVLPDSGFAARIGVAELDLDAWMELAGMGSRASAGEDPRDADALAGRFPDALPDLEVVAGKFILGGRMLGALRLQAGNEPVPADDPVVRGAQSHGAPAQSRWHVRHLQLDHPAGRLDASGSWRPRRADVPAESAMQFALTVHDGGHLLDLFGYPGVLRAGAGELSGRIGWRGPPMRLDTRSLTGDIALALGKGQFLKSEPGIAKLIGVLNLQSLRRRLVFDFRDLFAEGFAFDRISGSAHIVDGVAHTEDFRMKGVTAQVAIRGQADLVAETQSLVVQVRPEFDAGLASLAYAALANPVLGLGSFVAQMVLREPLQQMFGHEYDVTGVWDDPLVTRRVRLPAEGGPPDASAAGPPLLPWPSGHQEPDGSRRSGSPSSQE